MHQLLDTMCVQGWENVNSQKYRLLNGEQLCALARESDQILDEKNPITKRMVKLYNMLYQEKVSFFIPALIF
jgi:hypothetical protein